MAKRDKDAAIAKALAAIQKAFGASSATIPGLRDPASEIRTYIPSAIDVLDRYVIGGGGFPAGRTVELFGDEGSSKTSVGWQLIGQVQKCGGAVAYADDERSYDGKRANLFGVDPGGLLLLEGWTLEESLDKMLATVPLLTWGEPRLMVWDSLAAPPYDNEVKAAKKGGIGGKAPQDDRAYKLGRFMRSMTPLLVKHQVHLLIVNQVREKRGVMFGNNTTTPGGRPVKFGATIRVQLFSGKSFKDELGQHLGKSVTAITVKNKVGAPWRKAKLRLNYEKGWDNLWSTITLAKELKRVPKDTPCDPEGYARAVSALGWKGAAPAEVFSTSAIEEPDDDDMSDVLAAAVRPGGAGGDEEESDGSDEG